ncbi:MAG: hypothetical protein KAX05_09685 [Bacteroidales bacterium]|nr:hypothetical protein [Bacteroidales bacterium]
MARIVIREGIRLRANAGSKQLMHPSQIADIKSRIREAVDRILDDTEYELIPKNPPGYGVEEDTDPGGGT